jgi:LAO/AO transport system kinase
MLSAWNDSGVYIRSMATRGQRGGLSAGVANTIDLLGAFGFDVVVLETVGIGQEEIDVATVAETVVLLQVPGLGDSVQAIKAGVLEVADIYVVNKCDLPGADEIVRDLNSLVRMSKETAWVPPVIQISTSEGTGIESLIEEIYRHEIFLRDSAVQLQNRENRICSEAVQIAMREIENRLNRTCLIVRSESRNDVNDDSQLTARELADVLLRSVLNESE